MMPLPSPQHASRWVAHNARFDLRVLGWAEDPPPVDDTMLLAALLGEERVGLKVLDEKYHGGLIEDRIHAMLDTLWEERIRDYYSERYLEEALRVEADRAGQRWRKADTKVLESLDAIVYADTPSVALSRRATLTARLGRPVEPDVEDIPWERLRPYSGADAAVTMREYQRMQLQPGWDNALSVYRRLEEPLFPVLHDIETTGIKLDLTALAAADAAIGAAAVRVGERLSAVLGEYDLTKPSQLREALYDHMGLPVLATTKEGAPSTARGVLEELALEYPWVQDVVEFRHLNQLRNSFTQGLVEHIRDGRIHGEIRQLRADRLDEESGEQATNTWRLASSNPNLHNIPARGSEHSEISGDLIRRCFLPDTDQWFAADYSGIEYWIMMHLAQDPLGLEWGNAGLDPHRETAKLAMGGRWDTLSDKEQRYWRNTYKNANYLLIFKGGAKRLVQTSRFNLSLDQAEAIVDQFWEMHPAVEAYHQRMVSLAQELGYVETLLGHRRYLPEIHSEDRFTRATAERQAGNMPVQGTAADLIKLALRRAWEQLPRHTLNNVVHDEIDGSKPEDLTADALRGILLDSMVAYPQSVLHLDIPLRVEIGMGPSWGEAK